jgi:hypothetical protein
MVCTATKNSIEKRGENFIEHATELHMFWKYLYFLTYLVSKKAENFTGIENAIYEQFLKTQADWVPFEKEESELEDEVNKQAVAATPSTDAKVSVKETHESTAKTVSDPDKTVEGKLKTLEGRFALIIETLAKIEKTITDSHNLNIKQYEKLSTEFKLLTDTMKPTATAPTKG